MQLNGTRRREAILIATPPVSLRHARIMAKRRTKPGERLIGVSKHPSKGWYLAVYEVVDALKGGDDNAE